MNDLHHPINAGEIVNPDDVAAIKRALDETQRYLDQPEVRRMYRARADLQARLGELEPITLPRRRDQTNTQQKVQRCPHCLKFYDEDSESVQTQQDGISGGDQPDLGAGEPGGSLAPADSEQMEGGSQPGIAVLVDDPPSESQTTLLPEGPRTAEQEAALGIDIFGERNDPESPEPAQATGEAASTAAAPPPTPLDWVVEEAGKVEIKADGVTVIGTVAELVESDPNRCLAYINGGGKDQKLIAALTTYLYATKPDLMEPKEAT